MRTKNTVINVGAGIASQVLTMVLGLVFRTMFIKYLGEDYLGVNGLISSIMSILNLTELGIGTAITYSLYKPLAENDTKKIHILMNMFAKMYRIVGVIVLIVGLLILPFLDFFITGELNVDNLQLIYILYLINSAISYFFFAYKSTLLIADQKQYVIKSVNSAIAIVSNVIQIYLLYRYRKYIPVLVVGITFSILTNCIIAIIVNRRYPYISEELHEKLEEEEKKEIFKNFYALAIAKFSNVALSATDNLVVSKMVGTAILGIYSNYTTVLGYVQTFLNIIFGSVVASLGNFNATKDENQKYEMYKQIEFLCYGFYFVCSIIFLGTINHFISWLWGAEFCLEKRIAFIVAFNMLSIGYIYPLVMYRDTCGLYWYGKYRNILNAILNVGLSIILATSEGIYGVVLATIISRLVTIYTFEPFLIFKKVFNKSCKEYYSGLAKNCVVFGGAVCSVNYISNKIAVSFWGIILCALLSGTISIILYLVANANSVGMKELLGRIRKRRK